MTSTTANISALPNAAELNLREKLGQLTFVRIGSNLPPVRRVEEDVDRMAELLEECPIGGLLLFNGGPDTRASLDCLQKLSKIPLLVGSDIERGTGQQVQGFTLFPHAMAFDRLGNNGPAMVAQYAQALAQEAREAGIHITFAPVTDVNTNPKNPIIATRAYSEKPQRAAELARAYIEAAEAAGLMTTAKHFPGHGDTHQDSHDSLPKVMRSREQLATCELVPFQAAIDAGCSLIMTAHVAFPNIDPTNAPATLSSVLLQDVLRGEMGFGGAVCSDSLLMAGVRDRFANEEEMALATLLAGVDVLLDLREPSRVLDYLCDSVTEGKLPQSRVEEAFRRVWTLKQRAFERTEQSSSSEHQVENIPALAAKIATDAIEVTATGDKFSAPFDRDKPVVAILLKPFETAIDPPEQPLAAALRETFAHATYIQIGPNADAQAYTSALQAAKDAPQLLLAMIVRPAAWHAFGLRPEQADFSHQVIATRPDAILASLGVPYALQDFPDAAVRICTYSDVPVSQQALAQFLTK